MQMIIIQSLGDLNDVVGALVEELDVVADHHHHAPLIGQGPQLSGNGQQVAVVHPGGGLVEDDDAGVLVHGGGDDEPLLLPPAQGQGVALGQASQVQALQLGGAGLLGDGLGKELAVDKAKHYVHVEIYIVAWDNTTDVFFRALARAVQRGVKVRLLLDHIGSRKYPGFHKLGRRLDAIGVEWYLMLPLLPLRWRFRRPDLRNHRKMLIIDGERGFLGSLNMIDSSYLMPKNIREGRHWVDVMVELSGPVIASMNTIFAVDWLMESDELLEIVDQVHPEIDHDQVNVVQLVPSGPGYSTEPNLRMFNSFIHHAKERLVMCSPYFIPDESMLEAVPSACYRGVQVELLVSEQADQFAVGHAQSSSYQALLEAGVHIYLYKAPYVLHSKYVLADPDSPDAVGAVGSSNMDMRSFGLNYEVSLMITRGNIIAQLDDLTNEYLRNSTELTLDEWNNRSYARRYVDNIMRLTSALQ